MAIYGNVPPLARADRSDEWNRVVVKADGWMISAWVNGELVQQYNTLDHPELKHRQPQGLDRLSGPRRLDPQLRNFRVLEAPDGTGLDAWQQPPPRRSPATVVIDRLMNPERLSLRRRHHLGRCRRRRASRATSQASRCWPNWPGPGAVVRIARTSDEGRLAFYFDGEDEAADRVQARPICGRTSPLSDRRRATRC